VGAVARALHRITPNLRGLSERRRKLYANVVLSVVLYAAPIWGEAETEAGHEKEAQRTPE